MNCPWTDEERATLRKIYAAHPPGKNRKAALLRRLPGRTYDGIKSQIFKCGLAHPGKPPWRRVRTPGLSGKIYECITRVGPLSTTELAELLGIALQPVVSACGHLVRRGAIESVGPRPPRWKISVSPPGPVRRANATRRADETTGITPEDDAWMRYYREKYERRLAQRGMSHAAHPDRNG